MDPGRLQAVYKECMRNHAATLGTYASDGCCEYIPGKGGALPSELFCGACGCHRNFHRRETSANPARPLGGGGGGGHRGHYWDMPEIIDDDDDGPEYQRGRHAAGHRRQRTKFSSRQKAQMAGFAARIGWKIPKVAGTGGDESDDEVNRFCREIGVTRQVFKVWMHNHKGSLSQMAAASSISDTTAAAAPAEGVHAASVDVHAAVNPMEVQ